LLIVLSEEWEPLVMMDESAAWLAGMKLLRTEHRLSVHSIFCTWHWWDIAEGQLASFPLVTLHRDSLRRCLKDIERISGGPTCDKDMAAQEAVVKLTALRNLECGAKPEVCFHSSPQISLRKFNFHYSGMCLEPIPIVSQPE
jgi:hypothetical protein